MKDAKDVIAIVVDNSGGYVSLAIRLANEYKKVYYCNPAWQHSYPNPNLVTIGEGIDEIEVVDNVFDVYDSIDLWIFPDVYFGPFQEFLRLQGEIVWGSGDMEKLELYRDVLKNQLKNMSLPVGEWWMVKGISFLRKFLQKKDKVWVKINKWRGLIETFYVPRYELVKPVLDDIEFCRGIDPEEIEFIIESPIENATEYGYDGITVDGRYPEAWISGIERKDKSYFGQWKKYKELPLSLTEFNEKASKLFAEYKYRGFISLENRITGGKSFLTDFTARFPNPPGSLCLVMIKNLGAVIWAGANGEILQAEPVAQYGAEINFDSDWCVHHLCPVYIPKDISPFVKLKKHRRNKDGLDLVVPVPGGANDMGSVVGIGGTPEEAIKKVKDYASRIESIDLLISPETIDEAHAQFQQSSSL